MKTIVSAAIWIKDFNLKYYNPRNIVNVDHGYIEIARTHSDCRYALIDDCVRYRRETECEGFITSDNEFCDRYTAAEIAFKAGQITREVSRLESYMIN